MSMAHPALLTYVVGQQLWVTLFTELTSPSCHTVTSEAAVLVYTATAFRTRGVDTLVHIWIKSNKLVFMNMAILNFKKKGDLILI